MNQLTNFRLMLSDILPFSVPEKLHLSIFISCSHSDCIITCIRYCQDDLTAETDLQQASSESLVFIEKIRHELTCYFNQANFKFTLPYDIHLGTSFQQGVWQALSEIPAGEIKTYGELAKELKSSARAVGNACRRNLFPVIVPCHRVVSASGIGGYAGDTLMLQKGTINYLQIKQWLLAHEQAKTQ